MEKFHVRKRVRMKGYDYSSPGAYFITICTRDRKCILSKIVGTGVPDGPQNILTSFGKIADRQLAYMKDFYDNIEIDKYVIMPNHIHMIIRITEYGPSGRPVPTKNAPLRRDRRPRRSVTKSGLDVPILFLDTDCSYMNRPGGRSLQKTHRSVGTGVLDGP